MLFIKECAKNAYWARSALPAGQMPFCWDIGVNHNIQHTKNRSFQLLQKIEMKLTFLARRVQSINCDLIPFAKLTLHVYARGCPRECVEKQQLCKKNANTSVNLLIFHLTAFNTKATESFFRTSYVKLTKTSGRQYKATWPNFQ